ncbi:FAD-dependent oxidoreductase [Sphingobium lignivorans]|uniref:Choline dehydrogenase-like flavoprotein n=1 Tax=Sphingobium lignivorans TaxID=2735886 RepID=A0ABR6NJW8_9SPHN|nr:GMC family oxidoreductase [Sphingobium lignivorans]MBB5986947.1 choline dehydrogenase-like flavoprotein [Sphingobium lignivorans]
MAEDARGLGNETIEADLCIIGAGAAGITLASKFANSNIRVLLLESGGPSIDRETERLNSEATVTGLGYPLQASRLRFIGGTTNHWAGNCYRFLERDFEAKPGIAHTGWPIRLSDVEPFLPEASQIALFREEPADWDPADWRKRLHTAAWDIDPGKFTSRVTFLANNPATDDKTFANYLPRFEKAPNVRFLTNANVVELIGGGSVESARVRTIAGNEMTVRAKTFILATGGVENARLLLASRRSNPNGMGNQNDQVGRYFGDHVVISQYFVRNPDIPLDRLILQQPFYRDTEAFSHFVIGDEAFREQGLDDVFLRFDPVPEKPREGELALWRLKDAVAGGSPGQIKGADVVAAITRPHESGGALLRRAVCRNGDPIAFKVAGRLTPRPHPDSRITLSDRTDKVGMPIANLNWALADEGKHSLHRAFELFAQEAGRLNLGRFQLTFDPAQPWPDYPEMDVGFHHTCSTRMSDDPRNGVVDRNCRVHGMDNLYVAGSSVFSTAGSGSPTMMLVALSLRLADHLRKERFA